jgi:zinc transport system permease protein
MLIAISTAITVVLGMRVMGALLISSLIIFPCLTAMRVFKTYKGVMLCSCVLAAFTFFAGLVASFMLKTPTGATIVLVNLVAYLVFYAVGKLRAGVLR